MSNLEIVLIIKGEKQTNWTHELDEENIFVTETFLISFELRDILALRLGHGDTPQEVGGERVEVSQHCQGL